MILKQDFNNERQLKYTVFINPKLKSKHSCIYQYNDPYFKNQIRMTIK